MEAWRVPELCQNRTLVHVVVCPHSVNGQHCRFRFRIRTSRLASTELAGDSYVRFVFSVGCKVAFNILLGGCAFLHVVVVSLASNISSCLDVICLSLLS